MLNEVEQLIHKSVPGEIQKIKKNLVIKKLALYKSKYQTRLPGTHVPQNHLQDGVMPFKIHQQPWRNVINKNQGPFVARQDRKITQDT